MKKEEQRYKVRKGLIVQKLKGKYVIFDPDRAYFYSFNETASLIFLGLKKKLSKKVVLKNIQNIYGIAEKKVSDDYNDIISVFKKHKIVIPYEQKT